MLYCGITKKVVAKIENPAPYLQFSRRKPGAVSLVIKRAAALNAAVMREKTISQHREALQTLAQVRPILPGFQVQRVDCGGVACEWVHREGAPADKVICYFHGGSWALGNLHTAQPVGILLAEATGYRVLIAQYRLAPEHTFPAGLTDCQTVFDWLIQNGFCEKNIALFGDSAGGNLSLSLMHQLKRQKRALPCALGLASPVPDMTPRSKIVRSKDNLIYTRQGDAETDIFSLYAAEHDRTNPLLSPVYGDLHDFPPILIHVGGDEPLVLDCMSFSKKAYRQGVDITLKVYKGMFHDFSIVGLTLKESRQSIREFAQFFLKHLG